MHAMAAPFAVGTTVKLPDTCLPLVHLRLRRPFCSPQQSRGLRPQVGTQVFFLGDRSDLIARWLCITPALPCRGCLLLMSLQRRPLTLCKLMSCSSGAPQQSTGVSFGPQLRPGSNMPAQCSTTALMSSNKASGYSSWTDPQTFNASEEITRPWCMHACIHACVQFLGSL